MRDDEEVEAAVGVGRAGGVSEARRACLAPALWSRERGDPEAVEGTDLGGVGGGKSGGAGGGGGGGAGGEQRCGARSERVCAAKGCVLCVGE